MTLVSVPDNAAAPPAIARAAEAPRLDASGTALGVLGAISLCHLLNDMMQSLLPAVYPLLKTTLSLDYSQIGLLTLTNQITASLFQPLVGLFTDRRPQPFFLAAGMGATLVGLIALSVAGTFLAVLPALALVGLGSAVFHPESSRVARLASGGRHGLAQSLFQVGGNLGSSLGPLLAAFVILPLGQGAIAWFALVALLGMAILWRIGAWYRAAAPIPARVAAPDRAAGVAAGLAAPADVKGVPRRVAPAMAILLALILSKFLYTASLTNYYIFYLTDRFAIPTAEAQVYLFVYLASVAAGTILGGPIGDRIGRKRVIMGSVLGVLPFSLILPHVGLTATVVLTVPIGMILASAFSAILVYAQDLVPGKVGTISGLFFGLAFGIAGIGAALLGRVADARGIGFVYDLCSVLPALGALALFLPDVGRGGKAAPRVEPVPSPR